MLCHMQCKLWRHLLRCRITTRMQIRVERSDMATQCLVFQLQHAATHSERWNYLSAANISVFSYFYAQSLTQDWEFGIIFVHSAVHERAGHNLRAKDLGKWKVIFLYVRMGYMVQ
ncbi:g5.6 [Tranosema rostrale ichnovirus]|nr:g5.6 [Tranosema rostrale ichnovirus]